MWVWISYLYLTAQHNINSKSQLALLCFVVVKAPSFLLGYLDAGNHVKSSPQKKGCCQVSLWFQLEQNDFTNGKKSLIFIDYLITKLPNTSGNWSFCRMVESWSGQGQIKGLEVTILNKFRNKRSTRCPPLWRKGTSTAHSQSGTLHHSIIPFWCLKACKQEGDQAAASCHWPPSSCRTMTKRNDSKASVVVGWSLHDKCNSVSISMVKTYLLTSIDQFYFSRTHPQKVLSVSNWKLGAMQPDKLPLATAKPRLVHWFCQAKKKRITIYCSRERVSTALESTGETVLHRCVQRFALRLVM